MDNARRTAVKVLNEILQKGAFSNIVLGKELNRSNLNDKDRALATEIVYGTLKYKYTIDTMLNYFIKSDLEKMDIDILNILRISFYQMVYLDKIPEFAIVNEAVELAKRNSIKGSRLVNGVLRNYLRNKDVDYAKNIKSNMEVLSFKYSFPKWMVKLFINQYGSECSERILGGLNMVPGITVRVNNLKIDYEEAWKQLEQNGYDIEEGKICPEAIVITKGRNIEDNPLFVDGLITVQDESAMMVAPSMDLQEEITVLDLCSAPGGKTCHIAEIMNNTGEVFAFDIHASKLPLIKENAKRLGINNVNYDVLDATRYEMKYKEKADRVLIDVPCSGLGIIRKKPEIKWNKNTNDTKELVEIQRKIMVNASKYVKPGGKLIYSTCTLNKDENEENIKWFIKNHSEFDMESLYFGEAENIIYHKEGCMTILPDKYMDGFFIAKMVKRR
ncbi:16S rRNA (cytosine(967)-C(5))-methyltransferase RsmB [Clostridium thailandense]|uniref:16S rRNA (cytosine(967)-C(5))-methyltransferase n=1 Tax=Clostridium thailandense TaxID=2794346 RepID=A0A949X186_9CLOT|nr:16S rRNA (cytosine(967)-C(5))-methyltransferase RsmB [Clostridium thailandense]MBV7271939.1 16S rRNA (cytosine(967)-C(5))-methyltransferase RsmB [Clostridium thailandense]MCH5137165.1 16S rRNA (cytosine(967)-C(5))-methyltransferase RsmB [Clostridiaceae bacterium UIB06]